jgi:hypothetical protein
MRRKKRVPDEPAEPAPQKPPWEKFLETEERPNREDLAASHHPMESMLEPVPMPRWLRGRRRVPKDPLS